MKKTNSNNYCVIMAGGIGTRFWPMSRAAHPKQFIDILGTGYTLLQQTFNRFASFVPKENIFIVTNEMYEQLVKEQLADITDRQIILEPARRNTAPCIAYASFKIMKENKKANIIVAPSDHIITDENTFADIILSALKAVDTNNWLVTLGLNPTFPNTGYGYIQCRETNDYKEDTRLCKVKTFTEKPSLEMAESFIESGDFLWNSGIFIWSGKTIIEAFAKYAPDIFAAFNNAQNVYNTPDEKQFIFDTYTKCKSISIDYAVMEIADNVYVMRSNFGWSDLGTWGALYEHREKNENGNAVVGRNVMTYDCNNCIISMPKNKLVILQGLEDYIVVESDYILMVCKKSNEQEIRQFVNDVIVNKGEEFI